jgi:cyclopropane fatty-acyl-phospholipid synthase-like methyltransferase
MVVPPIMSTCHICVTGDVRELPGYRSLTRVTSDCKPWPAGGRLGVCAYCGSVQKFVDEQWKSEIASIYADYTIYFQAGGAEQAVFLGDAAEPVTRSEWLVRQVIAHAALPSTGRLLDIGCGNGAVLRAFSRAMPGWTLAGTELSDANREMVERIPRVEALYTGPLQETPGQFDMVSLVHVLEHISHPLELLAAVAGQLKPGGVLFIEVPDAERNPFDLLIADHVSHFTPATVTALLEAAGYSIAESSQSWVVKEISAVATYAGNHTDRRVHASPDLTAALEWLLAARAAARSARAEAGRRQFRLFGSSIAATWLANEVDCGMDFFGDEDPGRQGQQFMGRSVLSPNQVPAGSVVFVGIGGGVAEDVARRLSRNAPSVSWIPAPPLA